LRNRRPDPAKIGSPFFEACKFPAEVCFEFILLGCGLPTVKAARVCGFKPNSSHPTAIVVDNVDNLSSA
jgi:hypothetical protein